MPAVAVCAPKEEAMNDKHKKLLAIIAAAIVSLAVSAISCVLGISEAQILENIPELLIAL